MQIDVHHVGHVMAKVLVGALVLSVVSLFTLAMVKSWTRKTTGWIITAVISGIFCFLFALSGVAVGIRALVRTKSIQSEPSVSMTSDDGSMSLDLPKSWKPLKGLQEQSILSASNAGSDQYVIVLRETRQGNVDSIDEYAKTRSKALRANINDSSESVFKELLIQTHPARQCVLRGTVNNVTTALLLTCIETEDSYFYVLLWTASAQEQRNWPGFEKIALSFKTKSRPAPPKDDDDDPPEDNKSGKK